MKNSLLLLFILSVFSSFGIWREVPTSTTENLNKIEIINNTAFCVGDNGTILKSTDEGESWSGISTSATGNITAIKFINNTTGFFTTSDGFIFKTTNTGDSWTGSNVHSGGINGIDFLNANTGIAVGDNGFIFRTTNGGSSWTSLGSISVFTITGVAALTESLAVAVGTQGSYLVSEDAGENWTYKTIPTTVAFSKIEKGTDEKAIAVGSGGHIAEFTVATLTMSNATKIDTDDDWIKDVYVRNFDDVYRPVVVGFASSVYVLNSSWKTWDMDSVNNLVGIHFINDSTGLACGFNGKIYKTTSGAVPNSIPAMEKETIQLYPNPAFNSVNLKQELLNAELYIYSMNGQLVQKQFISDLSLNVSTLNKGLYFLKFVQENKLYTSRLIKQ